MTSEEFILEIHSTEDITSADYLKAVVEKCLQSLNNGEEVVASNKSSEPFNIEVITPEQVVESEQDDNVVNYIDFDEYMVNEVVICESDDSQPESNKIRNHESSGTDQIVEFDREKENEVLESFRNDHIYHHIYPPNREYTERLNINSQSYVTILDESNVEIVETKTKRGRKKGFKGIISSGPKSKVQKSKKNKSESDVEGDDESDPTDHKVRVKKKALFNKIKKEKLPKPVKESKSSKELKLVKESKTPKPPKPPKQPRIKKEKMRPLPKRAKPNNEVVIKKADGELSVATVSNITDPDVQAAIRTLKEGNKENDSSILSKNVYSIYDPEGKVILPFIPKKYNDAMPFWCDECEFKTGTRQRLKLHKLRKHGGVKQYQCCECSYSAHDAYSVRVHYGNMHQENKKYQCDQCNFACNYKAGLKKHINKAHGTKKPYQCSKCGYEQYNITILKQHIQSVHMGILPFSCRFCDKKFIDERRMLLHVKRLHYKVKRFRCAKCNFSAFTKCEVKKHLFSHHLKLATLDCSHCSYSTKSRQELAQHIKRVHGKPNGSKPSNGHNCQFCDVSLHLKNDLITHMQNFHGITKTYQCDLCAFVTFDFAPLKKHIKEKHNPDALKCKNCNFTTIHVKSLREHKKTHSVNVTFPCKLCNASFRYKMCLTKHEVAKHGRELGEEPQDDMNTTYEKKWISYDQSSADTTCEVITDGNAQTVTYVGVNNVANIELDRLIADTVAGEQDLDEDSIELEGAIPSYLCTACNIIFQDNDLLNWHINGHQLENKFQQLASDKSNICPEMSHEMIEVLERKFATCMLCGYVEDRGMFMVLHLLTDHFGCDIVPLNRRSASENDGTSSDMSEKLLPFYSCGTCDFTTSRKEAYNSHKEMCCDDSHYVIPCEIVISEDINNINQTDDTEPVEIVEMAEEQSTPIKPPVFTTVPANKYLFPSHDRKIGEVKRWKRRYNKNYNSSDEDVSSKRKMFNCPECIFVCEKKRVMAHHYINAHISTPRRQLNVIDLKLSLSEKLGVKLKPPIIKGIKEEEDSEEVDDPDNQNIILKKPSVSIRSIPHLKKIKLKYPATKSLDIYTRDNRDFISVKKEGETFTNVSLANIRDDSLKNPQNTTFLINPQLKETFTTKTEPLNQLTIKDTVTTEITCLSAEFKNKSQQIRIGIPSAKSVPSKCKLSAQTSSKCDGTIGKNPLRTPTPGKRPIKRPSRYDDGIDSAPVSKSFLRQNSKNTCVSKTQSYKSLTYRKQVTHEKSRLEMESFKRKDDIEMVCSKCDVRLSSMEALNMHTILAHGFSILLTCSYCCFTTMNKNTLKHHVTKCFLFNS